MSIKDLKFDTSDFSGKDISSLPDRPGDNGITGQQLKERFDLIPKMVIALGGFNSLIDELGKTASGSSGASNIGVSSISGVSGSNVQTVLGSLGTMAKNAKTAADTATAQGTAAESAALRATEAAENAAEKATAAENATGAAVAAANEASMAAEAATMAITEVKDYAAEQAQSAKDYVDSVRLEGGAVTSVFGRAGEVKAQAGDYTADMVGALPNTDGAVTAEKLASGAVTAESIGAAPNYAGTITETDLLAWAKKQTASVAAFCNVNTTTANIPVSYSGYVFVVATGAGGWSVIYWVPSQKRMYFNSTNIGNWVGWSEVYSTNNKPTAADVGAPSLDAAGKVTAGEASAARNSVTASRTITTADAGRLLLCYNAAVTLTVPTGLPINTEIEICRWSTSAVTIAAESGVTLYSTETARTIKNQFGVVCLKKITNADAWLLTGDLG